VALQVIAWLCGALLALAWRGMDRPCMAMRVLALHGVAWIGKDTWRTVAKGGSTPPAMYCRGTARQVPAWSGSVWRGGARLGVALLGSARPCKAWNGIARTHDTGRRGRSSRPVMYGRARHGKDWLCKDWLCVAAPGPARRGAVRPGHARRGEASQGKEADSNLLSA